MNKEQSFKHQIDMYQVLLDSTFSLFYVAVEYDL
jgi:hypothetical protein